jgi:hypothetical protein
MRALRTSAFAAVAAAAIVLTTGSAVPAMAAEPNQDWSVVYLYSEVNFTGSTQIVPAAQTGCVTTNFPVKSAIDYTGVVSLTLYANANCTGQAFAFGNLGASGNTNGTYTSYILS